MEYRMNNMNINKNDDSVDNKDDLNLYDRDTINYYYHIGKTVVGTSCNTIIEIISIICIVICSIILTVSTCVLTTSIYINVLVSSSSNHPQYQYRIPSLNNSILMYVTTICNNVSDCFDTYRIDTPHNTADIDIKEEHVEHLTENHYDADDEYDNDNHISYSDNIANKINNDPEPDDTTPNVNNCDIDTESEIDSDIEDITERMLQLRIDTSEVIDLCEDTILSTDNNTNKPSIVFSMDVSGGLDNIKNHNIDSSDNENENENEYGIIHRMTDYDIDKQFYYNVENDLYDEECKSITNND